MEPERISSPISPLQRNRYLNEIALAFGCSQIRELGDVLGVPEGTPLYVYGADISAAVLGAKRPEIDLAIGRALLVTEMLLIIKERGLVAEDGLGELVRTNEPMLGGLSLAQLISRNDAAVAIAGKFFSQLFGLQMRSALELQAAAETRRADEDKTAWLLSTPEIIAGQVMHACHRILSAYADPGVWEIHPLGAVVQQIAHELSLGEMAPQLEIVERMRSSGLLVAEDNSTGDWLADQLIAAYEPVARPRPSASERGGYSESKRNALLQTWNGGAWTIEAASRELDYLRLFFDAFPEQLEHQTSDPTNFDVWRRIEILDGDDPKASAHLSSRLLELKLRTESAASIVQGEPHFTVHQAVFTEGGHQGGVGIGIREYGLALQQEILDHRPFGSLHRVGEHLRNIAREISSELGIPATTTYGERNCLLVFVPASKFDSAEELISLARGIAGLRLQPLVGEADYWKAEATEVHVPRFPDHPNGSVCYSVSWGGGRKGSFADIPVEMGLKYEQAFSRGSQVTEERLQLLASRVAACGLAAHAYENLRGQRVINIFAPCRLDDCARLLQEAIEVIEDGLDFQLLQ